LKTMIIPPYLRENSKIRIVAPAGKVKKESVELGIEWLINMGYEVEVGKHVYDEFNQFAGRDEDRLGDLQQALDDTKTSAIICARGGYGIIRLNDKLDFSGFLKNPKWVVGYSDITVLHNKLNRLNVASIHGAMIRNFPKKNMKVSEKIKSLFFLLEGGKPNYRIPRNELNRAGKVNAELVGGNLSIIYSLIGTPFDVESNGKILFIEDIDEYLYHIDRMILSLKLAGKLDNLAGLLIGGFTRMKDNTSPFGKNAYEIIADVLKEYNYPVCFGFPAGHGKNNLALALGLNWELEVTDIEVKFGIL
jgi:muramoyltetrapeptide carboxypeptidase